MTSPGSDGRELHGRRVLVWGFGRHGGGLAAARHCAARGARVAILEQRPRADFAEAGAEAELQGWEWHVGDAGHAEFARAELVVASPAIPPRAWPAHHPPQSSPEALFFAAHRGPRIAVTGTKGKSTTSSICATLLGWSVAGNSHEPLLDVLEREGADAPLVCELSSFQLWYLRGLKPSFRVALFTSFARDHLDWHPDLEHYRQSKLALLTWAETCAIAPEMEQIALKCAPRLAKIIAVGGDFRSLDGAVLAARADLHLPGDHNARNACLAMAAALKLGVPSAKLPALLRSVRGLPHRLETVHEAGGFRFINDSIATTPESAIAGMNAVAGPLSIILGGSDKGADFIELASAAARRGAHTVLLGQTAARIAAALTLYGLRPPIAANLAEAVDLAHAQLPDGGTVLLSPACASFDMFRGFEDRGAQFTRIARSRPQATGARDGAG